MKSRRRALSLATRASLKLKKRADLFLRDGKAEEERGGLLAQI
jgi:hypothetical protein